VRAATAAVIAFADQQYADAGYPEHSDALAAALKVRVIIGDENFAVDGPPSIVSQTPDTYAPRQRFTMFHELAHILIQRSGLEDDLLAEVDEEDAEAHLELVTNHITGRLLIPDPVIRHYVKLHGFTPTAITEIRRQARASLAATIRRVATWQPEREATIFLVGDRYILDVASSDPWNRLRRYDRVPDLRAAMPDAELLALSPVRRRTLGLISR
jgi:IrrE N-terminal-like domain